MKKKITAILLCVCMVILLLPVAAFATPTTNVAKIGTTEYATLAAAVAAAQSGETITLIANAKGGVKIGEKASINLTIDLGGYTLDIKQTVGSAGTETNGMQLFKGSTITIKNGTIVTSVTTTIMVKNYANLTLEDVNISAANMISGYSTVNNCGQLTIKNCTIGAADANTWAVSTGNYAHGDVIVTNIYSGTIASVAIETPLWETGGATVDESVTLNISGGNIGKVGEYDWRQIYGGQYLNAPVLTNPVFSITGGSFGNDPSAYIATGKKVVYDSTAATYKYTVSDKNTEAELEIPAIVEEKAPEVKVPTTVTVPETITSNPPDVTGIVDAVKEDKLFEEAKNNLKTASGNEGDADIFANPDKIEIAVTPKVEILDYVETEDTTTIDKISFKVEPYATVKATKQNETAESNEFAVKNSFLNGKKISVTLPCGDIVPKEVEHISIDGTREIFYEGQFVYDAVNKTVTVEITHFSTINVYSSVVHPKANNSPVQNIYGSTTGTTVKEENPNTGAESAIGAVLAIAVVSLAALAVSKKK